jgi:N,N'-diacetyllegionaminate synthase
MKLISNLKPTINIFGNEIGEGKPVFIVAEIGVTANGSLEKGKALIEVAKESGADAVKFQTIDCDDFMADKTILFKYETLDGFKQENMYEMLKKNQFTQPELIELSRYAKQVGIPFYLTVDSVRSVQWAEDANSMAYKISSWDLRNYPLLEAVAKTKKSIQIDLGPVILGEIVQMLEFIELHGAKEVMLVHCSHASSMSNLNLKSIVYLKDMFGIPIGYSADTRETIPDISAVALGAKMIEKRLTLSRNELGHHHIKALEPVEFRDWINIIRQTESSLGTRCLKPSYEDLSIKNLYFTSIVASREIMEGEFITKDMLSAKRPGSGISPIYIDQIVGKCANREFEANEVITWEDWGSFV